jgi:hypothetical protein
MEIVELVYDWVVTELAICVWSNPSKDILVMAVVVSWQFKWEQYDVYWFMAGVASWQFECGQSDMH